MPFVNERTYQRYLQENREEEFHKLVDEGIRRVEEQLGQEYPILIGDKELRTPSKFNVRSPVDTSLTLGVFQRDDGELLRSAIKLARESYRDWKDSDWRDRVELTVKAANELRRMKYELAATITFENGKNRYEAVAEVDETIDYFNYYAQLLEENRGYTREMEGRIVKGEHGISVMRPYGPWLIISPFNFPLAITATMTLGALITGNTVVVKPSSDTPLSAYKLVTTLRRAGFSAEVVNYVTSPGEVVSKVMEENLDIAGFAFTGSREVGHRLLKQFISLKPRPAVLELGGKNATVITAKADLRKAVEGTFRGAFGFGGQKCSATSRVFVESSIYQEFLARFKARTETAQIGDPRQKSTFLGPLINKGAVDKFRRYVDQAISEGGRVITGGRVREDTRSYLVEPTIIVDLPYTSSLWRTELFVPIVLVKEVQNLKEAIRLVNDVDYGLTAGIFSQDTEEVEYFFKNVEAGVTYANRESGSTTGAMPGVQPFGGWKDSGWTGRNAGGPYYLLSFMREQARTTYD
ncbi:MULTISPECIES: L-glutamate gamma-semialdehyde dehydrogenase [Metallosphaera]|uniref:L-glutamate gamma-semialdehyde dehydrogenase n=3 Tax=Metallosphaera TaxID=41980 RepID=A4YDP2_METS5|nr:MULTISPECIES: L-glutamate gamma-semialdehyde dehydrogenase [Metallosphaera]ABP94544.1 delta-1-pyrroline-5-carboxylate dehydrogenase [Metallosphaera sedula DSM 5348]AIM26531.1 delta-1-pyrroline-5-carboxylate dehydrogenase [Metallosphaera sedula]AKV73521.1 aldehyde dehydrogenase [Metallosphaera sedula]AKV75763.1 aldehyde dehydrogenase [Metallosphaera sedula]AKV78010.1 aldehyde dehydrogenase [Metallosphaera sedula]